MTETPKPLSPISWSRLVHADKMLRKMHGVGFIDVEALGHIARLREAAAKASSDASAVAASAQPGGSTPSESSQRDAEPKETPTASQESSLPTETHAC